MFCRSYGGGRLAKAACGYPDVINSDLLGEEIIVIPAALNMLRLVMVFTRLECKASRRGDMDINVFGKSMNQAITLRKRGSALQLEIISGLPETE